MKTKSFAISMILKAVDQVSGPLTGMGGSVASFQKKVGTSALNVSNAWKDVGKNLASLGLRAAAIGGSMFALVKSTSAYGDEISDMSKILGMSTDALQGFRYIGKMSGVEVGEMDNALKKLTVNLGKSADGGGIASGALHALGLNTKELKEAGSDKVLGLIADKFAKIKDPSTKAALAVELFGKSGAGMVNVLSQGSAGLEKMQERAKKLGIILGVDSVHAAADFDDAWQETSMTLLGIKNVLGTSLMPMFQRGLESVAKWTVKIRTWAKENPELAKIVTKLGLGFAGLVVFGGPLIKTATSLFGLVTALGKMRATLSTVGGLGKLLGSFGPGAAKFLLVALAIGTAAFFIIKHWDKIGPVIKKVIDYIKPLAPTVAIITAGLWAMNLAMNANPVGLIILGITALIAGITLLIQNWDTVKTVFSTSIQAIGGFFASLWEGIKLGASNAFQAMKGIFFSIADSILTVFGGIVKAVLGAGASVGRFLGIDTTGLDNVIGKITDLQSLVHGKALALNVITPGAAPTGSAASGSPQAVTTGQGSQVRFDNPHAVDAGMGARAQSSTSIRQVNDSAVRISFDNLPRGTRVTPEKVQGDLQLDMGYAGAAY